MKVVVVNYVKDGHHVTNGLDELKHFFPLPVPMIGHHYYLFNLVYFENFNLSYKTM